ncbi:MAG TPA: hypothetical protein ENF26_03455 [Methanomicrobia archaeon]|nr:hypothetical protein [Methanomicrobia archaeon]HEX59187.1 hypothetical protein [Methanomicrobia archaeon]
MGEHRGLWLNGYVLLVGKRGRVGKYEYVARPGRETARAFSVVVEEHMPSLGDDTLVGSTEVFLPKSHARVHGRRVFVPEWLVRKSFALKDLQEAGLLLRAYVRSQKALRSDAAWDEFWHSVRGHELEWAERVLKRASSGTDGSSSTSTRQRRKRAGDGRNRRKRR